VRTFLTVVVTVIVTLATVAAVYLWFRATGNIGGKDPDTVTVQQPQTGGLTEVVSVRAEVRPDTRVAISARVPARIVCLPCREGDTVAKGNPTDQPPVPASVLVELDATDLQAALISAEANSAARAQQIEVEKARIVGQKASITGLEASLKLAQIEMERQKSLLSSGDVSQANVDAACGRTDELTAQLEAARQNLRASELNLTVLDCQCRAAEAEVDRARDALTYATITSPIDGVVTRIYAEEGEMVVPGTMNNPGTVIMDVADLSKMLLVAQVDETDVGRVAPGQKVAARIHAFPNRVFEGTVQSVALKNTGNVGYGNSYNPASGDVVKYYEAKILLDTDGDQVLSGSSADVEIEVDSLQSVMTVPSQAVLERKEEELPLDIRQDNPQVDQAKTYATVVYRLVDGKAVVTPVSIGASDDTRTQITGGLTAQDSVIVGPYKVLEGIEHGAKVRDEREVPAPANGSGAPGGGAGAGA
jgi:HlyD family secretion protein